jgi:hypothetical protein
MIRLLSRGFSSTILAKTDKARNSLKQWSFRFADKLDRMFQILKGGLAITPGSFKALVPGKHCDFLDAHARIDQILAETVAKAVRRHVLEDCVM